MPAWSGGGACLVRGVVSQHALRQTPPWTEFLTHASENITLRAVKKTPAIGMNILPEVFNEGNLDTTRVGSFE